MTCWRETSMCIHLSDHQTDCLSNLRFADDFLLFSTSLEQLMRMMRDFKRGTEKGGLKIHPDKTQILSNQGSNKRTEVTIDNIKVEVLPARECAKYLGHRNREPNQSCLGVLYQVQTKIDIDIIPPTSQTPLIQDGHYFYADVRR